MKKLACALLLSVYLGHGSALAHSDHGIISGQAALNIANKSVQQLTFKDFGFEVLQLDKSWKDLKASDYSIVEVLEDSYIVSAKNMVSEQSIYFHIDNNGQVRNVKNNNEF